MAPRAQIVGLIVGGLFVAAAGCSPHEAQLARGERYYEDNRYEDALALFRALAPNEGALSRPQQARYAYLRGMTDFRLGFSADAQYWLALAWATNELSPGGFESTWAVRITQALAQLERGEGRQAAGGRESVQVIEMPRVPPEPLLASVPETGAPD